ncbi:hypothetical protein CALCODRAFT_485541 [Calocera cornea HHB12733]|uniref:Uncharacterized protein n=1 Tax=Calocera cornea HHB12733 TaxID=1353952 RepID=A0A165EBF4_9BASI|nr:hypothetical protein CALCODRAFT_485541 [Calocera cornea HHB12733]
MRDDDTVYSGMDASPSPPALPGTGETAALPLEPPVRVYNEAELLEALEKSATDAPSIPLVGPNGEPLQKYAEDTWREMYRRAGRPFPAYAHQLAPSSAPEIQQYLSAHRVYIDPANTLPKGTVPAPQLLDSIVQSTGRRFASYGMPEIAFPPATAAALGWAIKDAKPAARPVLDLTDSSAADTMLRPFKKAAFLATLNGPPPVYGPHPFPGPVPVIPFGYTSETPGKKPHSMKNLPAFFDAVKASLRDSPRGQVLASLCLGYRLTWRTLSNRFGAVASQAWWVMYAFESDYGNAAPYFFMGTPLEYSCSDAAKVAAFLLQADEWLRTRPTNPDGNNDAPGTVTGSPVYELLMNPAGMHKGQRNTDTKSHFTYICLAETGQHLSSKHDAKPESSTRPTPPVLPVLPVAGPSSRPNTAY